jgi:serine/threonine protein kinase
MLLVYIPSQRLTALDALAHPYFDELRDPHTTYTPGRPLPELFNFDTDEISSNSSLVSILVPPHILARNTKSSAPALTPKEPPPYPSIPSDIIPNVGYATEEKLAQD